MTVLIVAEKPSVGRAIADVVGAKTRHDGYLEGNGYVVSWCRGHLVDLQMPDDYEGWGGRWDYDKLPMVPTTWQWAVSQERGARQQYDVLTSLMDRDDVTTIINACDADREGEGIFRRIYALHGCTLPVKRFWSSSLVPEAIEHDLACAKPWSDYDGLAQAAEGRAKADWLVGLNATRAYVTTYHGKISAGRVQTPVLALIVERTRAAENFEAKAFYRIAADLGGFVATGERFEDKAEAVTAMMKARATGTALVTQADYRLERNAAPKLYDLTNLQRDASDLCGLTADETLDALQALYEAKLVTYPRTDSQYLLASEADQARALMPIIASPGIVGELVAGAFDLARADVDRVVNDDKVLGHSALMPTRLLTVSAMSRLEGAQRSIATLVCTRFLAAVMEPATKAKAHVTVHIDDAPYTATDTAIADASWLAVVAATKDTLRLDGASPEEEATEDEHQSGMPADLKPGDELTIRELTLKEGKTTAPKYYTDATLLSAMANAGRRIEDAELARALNDEGSHPGGLGTPATRASIIERIISAGYAYRSGKHIVATPNGCAVIDTVDDTLKTPELTAKMELQLSAIEAGQGDLDAFLKDVAAYTADVVKAARTNYDAEKRYALSGKEPFALCPKCGKPVVKRGTAYQCLSNKYRKGPDGKRKLVAGCGFRVFETHAQKKLTENQMKNLIKGKTIKAAGFVSKKGKKFEAKLHLNDDYRLEFVFDDDK